MKNIIISLGEIVKPDLMKGIGALAEMIVEKRKDELDSEQAKKLILSIVVSYQKEINSFKMGTLSESEFDQGFLLLIKEKAGVELTVDELNFAWNQMNPHYNAFKANLSAAIVFNHKKDHKLALVSFTNPKDSRHLIKELDANEINYQLDDKGNLAEIDGVKIYFTYATQKTKAELINQIDQEFKDLYNKKLDSSLFFSSSILFSKEPSRKDDEIIYIYNDTKSQDNKDAKKKAEDLKIHCCLWDKNEMPFLKDVLNQFEKKEVLAEKLSEEKNISYRPM